MKGQAYISPAFNVIRVAGTSMIASSIHTVISNANLEYGGGSDDDARVKEEGTWDISWQ